MSARAIFTVLTTLALMTLCAGVFAQAPDLGQLLEKTGLKYSKLEGEGDSWRVPFDGEDDKTIEVFVTYNDENKKYALIFATAVDREDKFAFNREVLAEAMRLNNDYPGMKFVLDEDHGDIDCQTEVFMETATAESLGMYINLVASMTDENMAKLDQLAGGAAEEGGGGEG